MVGEEINCGSCTQGGLEESIVVIREGTETETGVNWGVDVLSPFRSVNFMCKVSYTASALISITVQSWS